MRQMDELNHTRSTLKDAHGLESYSGTQFTSDIDTKFPPEQDDIDSRFGASTGIGNTFSTREFEPQFSDSYQLGDNYRGRVGAPRGIFDDV